ncbi:MAG: GNAT family N-acetyltransferase [Bdellovibrionota bacterium]
MGCPEILTSRLRLRPHHRHDLSAAIRLWTDPIVTKHTLGRASTRQEVWSRILRYAGHWALMGFGYWVVEEKVSGDFVGEIGFAEFMRDMTPNIEGLPELGWALLPAFHGKGYATEAVGAAIHWGVENLSAKSIVCIIHPQNTASVRLAENCGFDLRETARLGEEPTLLWQRELS